MNRNTIIKQLNTRTSTLETVHQFPNRLSLHTSEGCHVIPWKDISHCEAMSNYCTLHLTDGKKIMLAKTLSALTSLLPRRAFVRVHQSHLVNISCIRFAGKDEVELVGKIKIPVARNRKKELIQRISEISLNL